MMSEKTEPTEQTERPEPPAGQVDREAEAREPESEAAAPVSRDRTSGSRTGSWLATLALLLALVAVGLWVWESQQPGDTAGLDEQAEAERAALSDRIDRLESRLNEHSDSVDSLASAAEGNRADLERFERAQDSVAARIEAFQSEIATLEDELGQQIQAIAEREGEQRQADRELERRMLLLEASSLLRLGQERAELAADWPAAREAYRRASSLLQQADDPRLGAARRELARELDALESIESPDWLRIQTRIERLSGQAHRWPRPAQGSLSAGEASPDEEAEPGWADSLKTVFGQLVRVRPRDSVALSDEEVDLLRQQIGLRLTAAELAAARRDAEELAHHLRSARSALTANFDPADASVIEALRELDALAELSPASAPSGLGRALAEIREHMDRS